MSLTRVPQAATPRESAPSAVPQPLTSFHTVRGLPTAGCQVQIAPSEEAASGFFCCGSTGRSIVSGGAARPQFSGALDCYMATTPQKNHASRPTRERSAGCAHPDIETPLVDQLTRINSELINGQRQLAKKHAKLQKVSAGKSQVLRMVAHDLRNPLSGILNATEYLLGDAEGVLEETDLKLLQGIESTSRFMLRLIDDMVEIATIESGRLLLDRKPTDVLSLIERILLLNRAVAERKKISIDVIAPSELPRISLDSVKMYRVIDNLVMNAVKFSSPGDKVMVRVETGEGLINISVVDQGPGIPAHELKTVLKPFQKGQLATLSKTAGTGLGLAIAKRIVEAHGGQLQLKSHVGKGSTLTVSLPTSAHAGRGVPHRARRPAQTGRTVTSSASIP
jgi:signal transduction histidine kinase